MSSFQDIIEAQSGSIKSGQNVLIVDDLLATGGEFIWLFTMSRAPDKLYMCSILDYDMQFLFSILHSKDITHKKKKNTLVLWVGKSSMVKVSIVVYNPSFHRYNEGCMWHGDIYGWQSGTLSCLHWADGSEGQGKAETPVWDHCGILAICYSCCTPVVLCDGS